MPARPTWLPRPQILSFAEIERLVRIAAGQGVTDVRITGGEPTARQELPALVRRLAGVSGVQDLAMTTNGLLLDELSAPLREAGLRRLNVSLDTLREERFVHITRRPGLRRVLDGLEAAGRAGFDAVKINMVVMRGVNDDEILAFADLARRRPWQVRFIEFMPLDADRDWSPERVVPGREILERIQAHWALDVQPPPSPASTARVWSFRHGAGDIGLISSVTEPFCSSCDRIRISADGQLRTCLFSTSAADLRGAMRKGCSDEELAALFRGAVALKEAGHAINSASFKRPLQAMNVLGG